MAKNSLLDPDTRDKQDDAHNPSKKRWDDGLEEKFAAPAIDDKDRNTNHLRDQEDNADAPESNAKGVEDVAEREKTASAVPSIPYTPGGAAKKIKGKLTGKQKGMIGGIIGLIITLLSIIGLIVPNFAIVNLKEVAVNKFVKDQLATYEPRSGIIMRYKTVPNRAPDTSFGCSIKVKCRFKGVSEKGVEKLRKAGFEVESKPIGNHPLKYQRITSLKYEVDGRMVEIDANEYNRAIRTSPTFNKMMHQAYKSKFALYTDKKARQITNKLRIWRGNQLGGATERRSLVQKFRGSIVGRTLGLDGKPIPLTGTETEDQIRQNQERLGQVAENVTEEARQSAEDFKDPDKNMGSIPDLDGEEVNQTAELAKAGASGAIKGAVLGPIAGANAGCTIYYMIAAVGFGAKVIASEQLIRYYYTFSNTADAIKAGHATPQQVAFLGTMLMSKDEKGRTFADSFGYNYIAHDKLGDSTETFKYKLGGGLTGNLIGIKNTVDRFGGGGTCSVVTNPFVQGAAFLAYIVSIPFSGGTSLAASVGANAAIAGAFAIAEAVVTPMLIRMVAGTLVTGDENGKDAGNAFTAGGGAYASYSGRARGMVPQTKEQAVAYDNEMQRTLALHDAAEREAAHPLDITNPASPAGSAFAHITPYALNPVSTNSSVALMKLAANPLSMFSGVGSILSPPIKAAGDEYTICSDPEYAELQLAADPFCNVKYGFDLAKIHDDRYNPEAVIDYMHDNGLIDDEGNPQGDYQIFLEECIDNTNPISPGGDGELTMKEYCLSESHEHNQIMMRLYHIDTTIYEGIQEQMDGEKLSIAADIPAANPGGTSGEGLKGKYPNGRIPADALCELGPQWPGQSLECTAANSFKQLAAAYRQNFGRDIAVTDSYRSYEAQVDVKRRKPRLAATPGTSNHGWGLAVDFGGGIQTFNTPQYNWMKANAGKYGWVHPSWAEPGGSKPEPWHWEFGQL